MIGNDARPPSRDSSPPPDMSIFSRFTSGVVALFHRDRVNRELDDEVAHYLEQSINANIARGMTREAAERDARAQLGSTTAVKDPARTFGWDVAVENFVQDVRYALRYLAKSPGFTTAAALSLALGIGANTAIFSMVNAMLIRQLPVAHPEQLVSVNSPSPSGVYSYPAFEDLRRSNRVFADLAAFGGITVSVSHDNTSDLISGIIATGNYFELLGVKPLRGRLLSPDDDRTPGAHPVAVISERMWKRQFHSRTDIVGLNVHINGQPFTIIGVTPAAFQGIQVGTVRDLFVPMMMQAWMRPPRGGYSGEMDPDLLKVRRNTWLFAVGRLNPDVSLEQATAATNTIIRSMSDWPVPPGAPAPTVQLNRVDDGPPGQRAQLVSVARLLSAVVLAVLIIACANVANLLLARASSRRKEIAVRLAIGATRTRLVRQLLTESVLLSALGGALGLGLALLAIKAVRTAPPPAGALPVTLDFAIDWRVLAFTIGLSLITGVTFGLLPALRASRPDLVPALKDQTSPVVRRRRINARSGLVVAQVAISFVLLVAAGLFVRSLNRAQSLSAGFDVDHLLTVPLNVQLLRYTKDQSKTFFREVVDRTRSLPGVASATIVRWVPLSGGGSTGSLHLEGKGGEDGNFRSEGSGFDQSNPNLVSSDVVGLDFFRTMGIEVKRGRDFAPADGEGSTLVAIVNESFVKRHYGAENPIGKRISLSGLNGPWVEIIGVAADSKYATLNENPTRLVYLPVAQNFVNGMTLVVRTTGDPARLATAVGREAAALDKSLPVAGVRTLRDLIGISMYAARAGAKLLSAFGALALVLAAVGLYGVLAYAVSLRTREFGLRMALGARTRTVLVQVLSEGALMTTIGVAVGLIAALMVTRMLRTFLFEVSPTDTATFVSTPVLLFAVAMLACLIPAIRATRVDPIKALKS